MIECTISWSLGRPVILRLIASSLMVRIDDLNSGIRVFTRAVALQLWSLFPVGFLFTSTLTIATLESGVDV